MTFDVLTDEGLKSCLDFIVKIDALKKVLRKTKVIKNERFENTAEHSWHLALMAFVLQRYSKVPIQIDRVVKMLLLHDLGEIEVGDVFLYDAARGQEKDAERDAIEKLFSSLPSDLRTVFLDLWTEFAEGTTAEAHFARAMDRFQPLLNNLCNDGGSWSSMGITREMALDKNKHIENASDVLWDAYQKLTAEAEEKGLFLSDK